MLQSMDPCWPEPRSSGATRADLQAVEAACFLDYKCGGKKRAIRISADFIAFTGRGAIDRSRLPSDALVLGFGDIGEPSVRVVNLEAEEVDIGNDLVVLAIARRDCRRLFGHFEMGSGRWYLPGDMRVLGRAIVAVEGGDEAQDMLRAARCTELLCRMFGALRDGKMVEASGVTTLTEPDILRVAAVHQTVSERWHERLTVASLARQFGLNREKLTRGYRELYRCTVPEALSERRLEKARQLLSDGDLPVSSIGYRCGYNSNASFTRAFVRRFGLTPSAVRRGARE
ncbi:helix-turn-helix domain-containing protein [Sphingopyxis terrae]|uniref:helix-turn-helix domain-containing protein n=1 Tax=Sphingopyxis terrae TaxID=33052 RepID=UPI002A131506|nr:AraC family transcriptional regulator [Sphingopyxis terrae]MDX8356515.1 AraC family transcriptional regulator [Sphingopyxis terrae]